MASRVVFDEAALAALFSSAEGPVGKTLARRAIVVEGTAKRSMSSGGGRSYRRGGVTHVASAPGTAPAVDTGRLRASITHELGRDSRGLYARIGTNVRYAVYLELGTRRMRPRPFLRPALQSATAVS
jgi:HK97 gp10 family phage protein